MTKGKRLAIVALLGLNLALLLGLVYQNTEEAKASRFPKAGYLVVTGSIGSRYDAVFVTDLETERLAAWKVDAADKKLVAIRGRELSKDFSSRDR